MRYETKRKIVKVVAGTAITVALALGVACSGTPIKDAIQYNNTQITYNESNYKLSDLYILTNDSEKKLCYQKMIDSKTETNFGAGISMGNGIVVGMDGSIGLQMGGNQQLGNVALGVTTSTKTIYGYIALDTNELIAIKGLESQFGYEAEEVKDFISFEEAKEKGFKISADEFTDLVPMTAGKSK